MAVTTAKLEASLELALVALGQVCQSGSNEEKIAASRELVQAVEMAGRYLSAKLSACDAVRGNKLNINCLLLMAQ